MASVAYFLSEKWQAAGGRQEITAYYVLIMKTRATFYLLNPWQKNRVSSKKLLKKKTTCKSCVHVHAREVCNKSCMKCLMGEQCGTKFCTVLCLGGYCVLSKLRDTNWFLQHPRQIVIDRRYIRTVSRTLLPRENKVIVLRWPWYITRTRHSSVFFTVFCPGATW